jgi:hypothetical protein
VICARPHTVTMLEGAGDLIRTPTAAAAAASSSSSSSSSRAKANNIPPASDADRQQQQQARVRRRQFMYFVLEYVDGGTLEQAKQRLTCEQVRAVTFQLLYALLVAQSEYEFVHW